MKKEMIRQTPFLTFSHSVSEHPDPSHFERHCHGSFEILYVVRGAGRYIVESMEYPLAERTILVIRPNEYHYVCPREDVPYERYVLHFDGENLMDTVKELSFLQFGEPNGHGAYFSSEAVTDETCSVFAEMDRVTGMFGTAETPSPKEHAMWALQLNRVLLLLSMQEKESETQTEPHLIARVVDYINRHMVEPITLDRVAQHYFISKYYLCRAFRAYTGVSIFTYLNTKRIAFAKTLLDRGVPATSVAMQVGFQNYSSFYRAYCKIMGEPPAYRR